MLGSLESLSNPLMAIAMLAIFLIILSVIHPALRDASFVGRRMRLPFSICVALLCVISLADPLVTFILVPYQALAIAIIALACLQLFWRFKKGSRATPSDPGKRSDSRAGTTQDPAASSQDKLDDPQEPLS